MEEQSQTPSMEDLQKQCEEYLAGWKRAQADYQNLKKEQEKERAELSRYANERLLRELLPVIEQFQTAMKFIPITNALPEAEKKQWENWLIGLKAVKSLWEQMALQLGLEPIATDGHFDPNLHDANGEEEAEGKEPGQIIRVIQNGWKFHGKVLQPARVIVAK